MLLPHYPDDLNRILNKLLHDTAANTVLLIHREGSLCAAQGKYTKEPSMSIIATTRYVHFNKGDSTRSLPQYAFKKELAYTLFYASMRQTHMLLLVLPLQTSISTIRRRVQEAKESIEQLLASL